MASGQDFDETSVCSDSLSLSLKNDNSSSYGGINSNLNDEQILSEKSINNEDKKKTKNNKKYKQTITFEWDKEENNEVYLTGSFGNWKQFLRMPKKGNIYKLTLPLPKALYRFKFRINDKFFLNKKYPVIKDGENICNYIDTSNNRQSSINNNNFSEIGDEDDSGSEEKSDFDSGSSDSDSSSKSFSDGLEDQKNKFFKKRKKRIKKIKYSHIYPKKINLNNYAPDVPYSYNYMYNIDVISQQSFIGNQKYYRPKENNILGENCSYKKIGVLPAVEINHIHSNNSNFTREKVLCSSFMRYRNKYITYLYYKPL